MLSIERVRVSPHPAEIATVGSRSLLATHHPRRNRSYSLKLQWVVAIYLACRKAEEHTLPASAPRSLRSLSKPSRLNRRSRTTAASAIQPILLVQRAIT